MDIAGAKVISHTILSPATGSSDSLQLDRCTPQGAPNSSAGGHQADSRVSTGTQLFTRKSNFIMSKQFDMLILSEHTINYTQVFLECVCSFRSFRNTWPTDSLLPPGSTGMSIRLPTIINVPYYPHVNAPEFKSVSLWFRTSSSVHEQV
jgi:hypothetical protein